MTAATWADVVVELALTFLGVAFLLVYPRRRAWVGRATWFALLGMFGLALVATVLTGDARLQTLRSSEDGATVRDVTTLGLVVFSQQALYALIGVLIVRDAWREPPGAMRSGMIIAGVAWALGATSNGFRFIVYTVRGSFADGTGLTVSYAAPIVAAALLGAVLGFMLAGRLRRATGTERRVVIFGLVALELAALSGLASGLWNQQLFGNGPWLSAVTDAFWKLAIPILVTYALVRHQVYDIDLEIKWALKQSTVAAIFIAAFFIVSESAAAFFGQRTGSTLLGIVAAGLLVFFIAPLQRFADRVSSAALPGVDGSPEYVQFRKYEVYKGAFENALLDGVISEDERIVLDGLKRDMAIPDADAQRMERDLVSSGAP